MVYPIFSVLYIRNVKLDILKGSNNFLKGSDKIEYINCHFKGLTNLIVKKIQYTNTLTLIYVIQVIDPLS